MEKLLQDTNSKYLFQVRPDFVIDAQKPLSCYARYANDNADESKLNAELIDMPPLRKNRNEPKQANRVYLRFLKDIYNNEEIFCAYGENYWTDHNKR
jgi:SET domain-containing protein